MAFIKKESKTKHIPVEFQDLVTPEDVINLAKKKGIETSPLNVGELAEALGINTRYEPMPDDKSGTLYKDSSSGKWTMCVNSLHHPHRQRFTIAHEIGHRIRHAGAQDEFVDEAFFRNGNSNEMEAEANFFAAELLIPEAEFSGLIKKGVTKVEELCRHFQVSSMAVRVRAKVLGYKGHNL